MESSIYGVPPSAAQMGRSDSSVSGIRAPVTVDDSDFEGSVSSKSRSYYSGSELEDYEGGEVVAEVVEEEGEEIVEKTDLVKEFAVSGGEVIEDSSKFVQESGNVGKNDVFRPLARNPSGRIYRGVGTFEDSDDSGSLLSDSSDDEVVEKGKNGANLGGSRPIVAVVDDEVEEVEEGKVIPVMGNRVLSARKLAVPVAKISGDSDDDSYGSVVSDEEGFSGVARVPGIEVVHRIDSAPIVRMLEGDDEGGENESQGENVVEMELDGDLLDEKEPIVVESSLVQDKGLDFDGETVASSLAMDGEFIPTSELGHNGGLIHLDEDIKEVDVVEDRKECLELVDFRESIVLPNISSVALVAEAAASLGDVEDDCIFNQNYESENVESTKQGIEQAVESFSFDGDHETSSARQCVDINEMHAALEESMSEYICESLADDASSVCAVDAGQSVFEGSNLEQETGKEAEACELLASEVEESSFHSDNKAVIAEMDVVLDHSQEMDSEDFRDEVDADGEITNGEHVVDPSVLAALFEAVRSAAPDDDAIKVVSVDCLENSSLGSNVDDLSIFDPSSANVEALSDREKESVKKMQKIQVKYLRLLDRLGRSPQDSVASEVLYQLTLAAGSSHSLEFHLDSIKNTAMELEAQTKDNSDFPLSVFIIGKTGVGKSATVNSIFGESSAVVDAFEPATPRVREITGSINGVKLKIFDTPGLRTSVIDQSINRKILASIKKVMKKSPPDVILYVDRLDAQQGNLNDLPLLRLVTSCLGSSMWRKSIVAFTHGAALPPDGPDGCPISYEAFVSQQLQVVQRLIRHSAGELVLPVCVVENHPFAEKNGDGERWRSQLLLLCCSMKILSEVSSVVATQSPLGLPPLSHYMSSFLKSNDQNGDIVGSDVEPCNSSDPDQEGGVENNDLPPFKTFNASQVAELNRDQEAMALPLADMAFPPSFDGDEPSFRYRVSKPSPRLLTRPVLIPRGWDHDCSYDGLIFEDKISIANGFPVMISIQLRKDKKDFKIQLHSSVSAKIKNFRKHRAAAITSLRKNVVSGLKVEDCVAVGKRAALVGNAGIIQSQDDAAYGVNLFFNQDETSMGISAMRCRDENIFGCNLHSCISINGNSKLDMTAAFNSRLRGKICIKTSCSEQLQIAALALVPIARAVAKKLFRQPGEDGSV